MKLHWSPRSPFVRKLMICSHEIGVAERMTCVRSPVEMTTPNPDVLRDNPLGKIPALVLDDGAVLYDSRVICEYLDTLHNGARMFPTQPAQRWIALRRQALGDGMLDALLIWRFERAKPENMRMQELMTAYALKINTALAALEAEAGALAAGAFSIGHIAIGVALSYLDFRFADLAWRNAHTQLAAWHKEFEQRRSVIKVEVIDDS
jgi:glutathione S-transferase